MDEPELIQENAEQRPNNVQKQSHHLILLSHSREAIYTKGRIFCGQQPSKREKSDSRKKI
jgi:hypothetical protein